MLRNLKDLNEARVFESTHAKFKPRVADLTKDWQRNEKKDTFLKIFFNKMLNDMHKWSKLA